MQHLLVSRDQSTRLFDITADVAGIRIVMVNVYFIGQRGGPWHLVDAGLPFSAGKIRDAAAERYGKGSRPEAILLTHGHFDHVGAVRELADEWNVPVYAHRLELPYVTGKSKYPPPDSAVGGGLMAFMAPLYPRRPIDVGNRALTFSEDGLVPGLPGWRWIHTPGHTAGHVSFFRESDRLLIVGDAFTTAKQESLTGVLVQKPEFNGPPKYYTSDWDAARRSVELLAGLRPQIVSCGHGLPIRGENAANGLQWLAENFDEVARPKQGRYVPVPAVTNEEGIVSLPPAVPNRTAKTAGLVAGGLLAGYAVTKAVRRKSRQNEN